MEVKQNEATRQKWSWNNNRKKSFRCLKQVLSRSRKSCQHSNCWNGCCTVDTAISLSPKLRMTFLPFATRTIRRRRFSQNSRKNSFRIILTNELNNKQSSAMLSFTRSESTLICVTRMFPPAPFSRNCLRF